MLTGYSFGLPAYTLVESWGRRPLLLTSIPGMAISLIACGSCFYINNDSARIGAVSFFIFVSFIPSMLLPWLPILGRALSSIKEHYLCEPFTDYSL